MQVFEAWDIFKGDSSIIIGIIDAGALQDHEDLVNSIWRNEGEIPENGIDDDNNGYIDDYNGVNFSYLDDGTDPASTFNVIEHGTKVAGIAGATVNNKVGIAGIAYNCRIFPMKTSVNGSGNITHGFESMIYAAQNGIKVVTGAPALHPEDLVKSYLDNTLETGGNVCDH